MVSFQCDSCGDVFTRKKLDNHLKRCRNGPITCIDCHTTFYGNEHKSHTSCMTESQKYEGSQQKQKQLQTPKSRNGAGSTYRPPTVEDAPENGHFAYGMQVAKVDVPPPAPSPPESQPTPVNVFDFLVSGRSPPASESSAPSSPISPVARRRTSQSSASSSASSRPPSRATKGTIEGVSYGNEPIARSLETYASDLALPMDVDTRASQLSAAATRTPAPRQLKDAKASEKTVTRSTSEKKRKRPQVEELDLSESRKSSDDANEGPVGLHTGLTGGLARILSKAEFKKGEASPLSPKKRSKHSKAAEPIRASEDGHRKHRSSKSDVSDDRSKRLKKHRHEDDDRSARRKALESGPAPKAIEYHKGSNGSRTASREVFASHSEFFLSLIDKDHRSQKGQSIWGALKTFHEGLCEEDELELYEADGQRQREEKRLLKALRVKRNRNGEYVLFARPDYEVPDEQDGLKRIEA